MTCDRDEDRRQRDEDGKKNPGVLRSSHNICNVKDERKKKNQTKVVSFKPELMCPPLKGR